MFQVIFELEINKTNKMPNQDIKLELRDSLWKVKFCFHSVFRNNTHSVSLSCRSILLLSSNNWVEFCFISEADVPLGAQLEPN